MADGRELRDARLGENEALYRRVNEKIEGLNDAFDQIASIGGQWLCECADLNCTTPVFASVEEYGAVRANALTFMVAPGHVDPEVEHVVRGNERFTVVKKHGEAAEVATETYDRDAPPAH